jgi:hypothetical protein
VFAPSPGAAGARAFEAATRDDDETIVSNGLVVPSLLTYYRSLAGLVPFEATCEAHRDRSTGPIGARFAALAGTACQPDGGWARVTRPFYLAIFPEEGQPVPCAELAATCRPALPGEPDVWRVCDEPPADR